MEEIEVDIDDAIDAVDYGAEDDKEEDMDVVEDSPQKRGRIPDDDRIEIDGYMHQRRHPPKRYAPYHHKIAYQRPPPRHPQYEYRHRTYFQKPSGNSYRRFQHRNYYYNNRGRMHYHHGTFTKGINPYKEAETMLVVLLDSFDTAKQDIIALADRLATFTNYDDIVPILVSCIASFPTKTGAYASVVAIVKQRGKSQLLDLVAQQVLSTLVSALENGNRIEAILMLRFLVSLESCNIKDYTVYSVIERLLQMAKDLESKTYENQAEHVKSTIAIDNLYFIVLSSIPWFGRDEFAREESRILKICQDLVDYNKQRAELQFKLVKDIKAKKFDTKTPNAYCNPYMYLAASTSGIVGSNYQDRFTSGIECLDSLIKNRLVSCTTYRFFQSQGLVELIHDEDAMDTLAGTSTTGMNALMSLDSNKLKFAPIPIKPLTFAIDIADEDELLSKHDEWLLHDHVANIIDVFSDDSLHCATQCLNVPINQRFKEYGIADALLNVMLTSVYCSHGHLYKGKFDGFGSMVVQHMCSVEPITRDIFEKFLSQLIERIEDFDTAFVSKLCDVCAYYFSCEFYKDVEDSDETQDANGEPTDSGAKDTAVKEEKLRKRREQLFDLLFRPKNDNLIAKFNQRLLDKICRLVYVDSIIGVAPERYKEALSVRLTSSVPLASGDDPVEQRIILNALHFNTLTPEENDARNAQVIHFFKCIVNQRRLARIPDALPTGYKYKDLIGDNQENIHPSGSVWSAQELLELFWVTLVCFGNKTLTHLLRLVDFHGPIVNALNLPLDQVAKIILKTSRRLYHKNNTKRCEVLIEHTVKRKILTPEALMHALFDPETMQPFANDTLHLINYAIYLYANPIQELQSTRLACKDARGLESLDMEMARAQEQALNFITAFLDALALTFTLHAKNVELLQRLTDCFSHVIAKTCIYSSYIARIYEYATSKDVHPSICAALGRAYNSSQY